MSFRIYNTHMALVENARLQSARLLCSRISDAGVPSILVGDLNATPTSQVIATFEENGLIRADKSGAKTIGILGRSVRCLDYILVTEDWRITGGEIIRDNGKGIKPSDHCGILATAILPAGS